MENKNQNQEVNIQELLLKIYENTEKTRKHILWAQVFSIIRTIIIVVPIIFAIIYLPPLFQKALQPYQELLQLNSNTSDALQGVNINKLLETYYK